MQKIRVDNGVLEVNFKGLLSPRQEEVSAWSMSGKNRGAIATILGTSPETVKKHLADAYAKLGVSGTDNPMALLQLKAFHNRWARFLALILMFGSCNLDPDGFARLSRIQSSARTPIYRTKEAGA